MERVLHAQDIGLGLGAVVVELDDGVEAGDFEEEGDVGVAVAEGDSAPDVLDVLEELDETAQA